MKVDISYSDTDSAKKFMAKVHQVMTKCEYRKDMDGIGVCSLHIVPCERVLYRGDCEAVVKWLKEKGGEKE